MADFGRTGELEQMDTGENEELARHDRIAKLIEANFDEIDPDWRKTEYVEPARMMLLRVTYSWGVQFGEVRSTIGGPGVTDANRAIFEHAILDGIKRGAPKPD
jgi:hypothetical protein